MQTNQALSEIILLGRYWVALDQVGVVSGHIKGIVGMPENRKQWHLQADKRQQNASAARVWCTVKGIASTASASFSPPQQHRGDVMGLVVGSGVFYLSFPAQNDGSCGWWQQTCFPINQ